MCYMKVMKGARFALASIPTGVAQGVAGHVLAMAAFIIFVTRAMD